MTTTNTYAPGQFSWADLATTDADAAKRFYGGLFGWTFDDVAVGPDSFYTMCLLDGQPVCALYRLYRSQQEAGVPPHWKPFVTVDSADACVERALELGGTGAMPAMDVMDAGRMAMIQDPTGARLALWVPRGHQGAARVNELGSLCWAELLSHDCAAAEVFYQGLFGWVPSSQMLAEGYAYTQFSTGGSLGAGMMAIQPKWGDMPSLWAVYFAVADCDASAAWAVELGGVICEPPFDVEVAGRIAVLHDPQGAMFSIICPNADNAA